MKHFLTCATLSGIALLFTQAHAESTSGHFQARLTLVATCSIEQASTTTMPSLAADVTCSKGSSYNLGRSHSRGDSHSEISHRIYQSVSLFSRARPRF